MTPNPIWFVLLGLLLIFPTAGSFGGTTTIAVLGPKPRATANAWSSRLGYTIASPSIHRRHNSNNFRSNFQFHHGIRRGRSFGSSIRTRARARTRTELQSFGGGNRNEKRGSAFRGRSLQRETLSAFDSMSKRLFKTIRANAREFWSGNRSRSSHGKAGKGGTENEDANGGHDRDDPLDRVRVILHLPLRRACASIAAYLLVGVLAYGWVFREASWSILDALYFSTITLCTIGYGDLVPSTTGGKLFAAFFGMSGILLWSSAIATVGTRMVTKEATAATTQLRARKKDAVLGFYDRCIDDRLRVNSNSQERGGSGTNETAIEGDAESGTEAEVVESSSASSALAPGYELEQESQDDDDDDAENNGSQWSILAKSLVKPFLLIVSGGAFIGRLEGWNLCDSFYYSLITATTIGFGDQAPATKAGKAAAIVLIPVLLASAGNLFASFGLFVIRKRTRQLFALERERAEWLTDEQAHEMDRNGDGKVSRAEYVLYMLIETGIVDGDEVAVLEEQFERFDVTRSGYIEAEDLEAMRKVREQPKPKPTSNSQPNSNSNLNLKANSQPNKPAAPDQMTSF